jgi:hypothetical protein
VAGTAIVVVSLGRQSAIITEVAKRLDYCSKSDYYDNLIEGAMLPTER